MIKEPSLEEAKRLHAQRYPELPSLHLKGPRWEVLHGEEGYPDSLLQLSDPPERLFGIGNIHALRDGLAVIGARKATPYGRSAARQFACWAAERGIPVISGGAIGCDSEAHRGALEAKGETVVVLGGGCDKPYPRRNAALFQEVIDGGGAVVSERHWDFPPLPYTFRMRNRIIAGLSRATLIVEAGLPSGTFSTADDALGAGKEVLAVPGPITSPTSMGANRLIYQGATPVVDAESFEDSLVALFGCLRVEDARPDKGKGLEGRVSDLVEQDPVYAALLAEPMRIEQMLSVSWSEDELVGEDKLTALMVKLAMYERDGLITRFPDGRYGPARV